MSNYQIELQTLALDQRGFPLNVTLRDLDGGGAAVYALRDVIQRPLEDRVEALEAECASLRQLVEG